MRRIVLSMHVSLDGFVAGAKGEMDWIKLDDEIFDLVGRFTNEADTALYGRVTWEMMDSYWPNAGDTPNASKHDVEHSQWYNKVDKLVLTKTLRGRKADKTKFISDNVFSEINSFKQAPGKNVMIFGSPTAAHSLMEYNLIDEYWLFVNPVLLGQGIPLFGIIKSRINLTSLETIFFRCGVTALHYSTG